MADGSGVARGLSPLTPTLCPLGRGFAANAQPLSLPRFSVFSCNLAWIGKSKSYRAGLECGAYSYEMQRRTSEGNDDFETRVCCCRRSLLALGGTLTPAAAEDWPTRPVTMVVPFPPGGGTDVLGRIIGRRLSEILGQQVIIDNVGGAGGMIGSNKVAKATPDGYEFVLGSRADAINQTLYKHPLYDLKEDLVPVILVADQPMAMIARHDLPVDGLQTSSPTSKRTRRPAHRLGRHRFHGLCRLRAVQSGDRRQGPGHPVSRRRPGFAGSDRRPVRLFHDLEPDRGAADPERPGQRHRRVPPRAAAVAAKPADRLRAGHEGFRRLDLVRFLLSQGTPDAMVRKLHDATAAAMDTPSVQEALVATGTFVVPPEHRSTAYLQTSSARRSRKTARRYGPPACPTIEWRDHARHPARSPLTDPHSPYYNEALLERDIGVRFKGVEKTNVDQYCVSEGWIRVEAGKGKDRLRQSADHQAFRRGRALFQIFS